MKVSGTFEVSLKPLDTYAQGAEGVDLGRMSIDKIFRGDLEATSQGEMLSAITGVDGSAGYVAIEQVTGSLSDRRGSFVLQHFGIMEKGADRLILEVVPGSASGELAGLRGRMTINAADGEHSYEFDYQLG